MGPLENAKHEQIALSYVRDPQHVGARAYLLVFPNCSRAAAHTAFSRLLKKAKFAARIAELKAAVSDQTVMDLREVLAELSKLGRANMQDYIQITDAGDAVLDFSKLTREQAAAIGELTVETSTIIGEEEDEHSVKVTRTKFKLHDKRGALAELRRHLEPIKHEHTGKDGTPLVPEKPLDMLEIGRSIAFALALAEQARRKQQTVEKGLTA